MDDDEPHFCRELLQAVWHRETKSGTLNVDAARRQFATSLGLHAEHAQCQKFVNAICCLQALDNIAGSTEEKTKQLKSRARRGEGAVITPALIESVEKEAKADRYAFMSALQHGAFIVPQKGNRYLHEFMPDIFRCACTAACGGCPHPACTWPEHEQHYCFFLFPRDYAAHNAEIRIAGQLVARPPVVVAAAANLDAADEVADVISATPAADK